MILPSKQVAMPENDHFDHFSETLPQFRKNDEIVVENMDPET